MLFSSKLLVTSLLLFNGVHSSPVLSTDQDGDVKMLDADSNTNNDTPFTVDKFPKEGDSLGTLGRLPTDLQLKVAQHLGVKDGITTMRALSRPFRDMFSEYKLSPFSIIGTKASPENSLKRCRNIEELFKKQKEKKRRKLDSSVMSKRDSNVYETINELYISQQVWRKCGFSPDNLRNIEVLEITWIDEKISPESQLKMWNDIFKDANELIDDNIWNLQEKKWKKLKRLDIFGNMRDGILHILLANPILSNNDVLAEVERKLKSGLVDVNAKNSNGNTPLHFCMYHDLHRVHPEDHFSSVDCINLLVKYGAKPNIPNKARYTAVHVAAALEYSDPLIALMNHGGNVNYYEEKYTYPNEFLRTNAKFKNTETPLHISSRYSSENFLDALHVKNIFNHVYKENRDITPSESGISYWNSRRQNRKAFDKLPIHELVNHPEIDFNVLAGNMGTPLNFAIKFRNKHAAMIILNSNKKNEINIESSDACKNTPLMLAVKNSMSEVVNKLIDRKASVHAKNSDEETVLDIFIKQKDQLIYPIFSKLVDAGMDLVKHDGTTIYHLLESAVTSYDSRDFNTGYTHIDNTLFSCLNLVASRDILGNFLLKRDSNGYSGLFFLLKRISREWSVLSPTDQKSSNLFITIVTNVKFPERMLPHDILDAHFLFHLLHQQPNRELVQEVLASKKIPEVIVSHFQAPFLNDEGLVFSDSFETNSMNIYKIFNDKSDQFAMKLALAKYSPSIFKLVRVVEISKYDGPTGEEFIDNVNELIGNFPHATSFTVSTRNGDSFLTNVLYETLKRNKSELFRRVSDDAIKFMQYELDNHGDGLWHQCIKNQNLIHKWCIPLLFERNCDPDAVDSEGLTILHKAVLKQVDEAVVQLAEGGANVNVRSERDWDGNELPYQLYVTPLHLAVIHYVSNMKSTIELLIKYGAQLDLIDAYGKTAFRYAVMSGNKEVVDLMLEKDTSIAVKTSFDSQSALMDAIIMNKTEMVKILKESIEKNNPESLEWKNVDGLSAYDAAFCAQTPNQKILNEMESVGVSGSGRKRICKHFPLVIVGIQNENRDLVRFDLQDMRKLDALTKWRYISLAQSNFVANKETDIFEYLWRLLFKMDKHSDDMSIVYTNLEKLLFVR